MEARLSKILISLTKEYIRKAEPIGSEFIVEHYHLGVSPATVRNDLSKLTQEGYLDQPHVSAGRIPTNRGWRFFVDHIVLANPEPQPEPTRKTHSQSLEKIIHGLAEESGIFGACIQDDEEVFFHGLPQLFSQPDFENRDQFERLAETIEELREEAGTIFNKLAHGSPNILIGEENQYLETNDDLSWLFTYIEKGNHAKAIVMLVGPKRMNYEKNWEILRSAEKLFSESNLPRYQKATGVSSQ